MGRIRRSSTTAFKADAVRLVRQQAYTVAQACQALDLGETVLRRWLLQYEGKLRGQTPQGKGADIAATTLPSFGGPG
ncbi:transposase [Candidatus Nitrospira neomarina]|uniref:Transposase n=1 Tax=Candidatus Nitrospira neomarina TaxID=3020899 RepID=A0AA96GPJ8_9BACT|nr:transposase [Candidatus Nitrospira neomarina]WNM64040.1 transposase [Candidatus Nitrospira neomarina]